YVGLALADSASPDAPIVAEYGISRAGFLTFPLVHQGIILGELRLAARSGERLRERDHRLIADLAPQVAAAVHAVGLSQELRLPLQPLIQPLGGEGPRIPRRR